MKKKNNIILFFIMFAFLFLNSTFKIYANNEFKIMGTSQPNSNNIKLN